MGSDTGSTPLPPQVEIQLDETVREYWLDRVRQHFQDSYSGITISKFPEDLRVYEHLLWLTRPQCVIELGTQHGGSALWFRDRLRNLAAYGLVEEPIVISIDLDVSAAEQNLRAADPDFSREIILVAGDITDPSLPERVESRLPRGFSAMVIEDSAHVYETTMAALQGFARFVAEGGFFVVEDGCVDVDAMRLSEDWPRGVLPAVREWLGTEEGSCFKMRRDMELYGLSCHPEGFLQRVSSGS